MSETKPDPKKEATPENESTSIPKSAQEIENLDITNSAPIQKDLSKSRLPTSKERVRDGPKKSGPVKRRLSLKGSTSKQDKEETSEESSPDEYYDAVSVQDETKTMNMVRDPTQETIPIQSSTGSTHTNARGPSVDFKPSSGIQDATGLTTGTASSNEKYLRKLAKPKLTVDELDEHVRQLSAEMVSIRQLARNMTVGYDSDESSEDLPEKESKEITDESYKVKQEKNLSLKENVSKLSCGAQRSKELCPLLTTPCPVRLETSAPPVECEDSALIASPRPSPGIQPVTTSSVPSEETLYPGGLRPSAPPASLDDALMTGPWPGIQPVTTSSVPSEEPLYPGGLRPSAPPASLDDALMTGPWPGIQPVATSSVPSEEPLYPGGLRPSAPPESLDDALMTRPWPGIQPVTTSSVPSEEPTLKEFLCPGRLRHSAPPAVSKDDALITRTCPGIEFGTKSPAPFEDPDLMPNTVSELRVALLAMKHKQVVKDQMIDSLAHELKARASSHVWEDMLTKVAENRPVPDFDRSHLVTLFSEPNISPMAQHRLRNLRSGMVHASTESPDTTAEEPFHGPINVQITQRILESNLLVQWTVPENNVITGFEIFVNGQYSQKVRSGGRFITILHDIDFDREVKVSVYAVTRAGRLDKIPGHATYIPPVTRPNEPRCHTLPR